MISNVVRWCSTAEHLALSLSHLPFKSMWYWYFISMLLSATHTIMYFYQCVDLWFKWESLKLMWWVGQCIMLTWFSHIFMLRASRPKCTLARSERASKSRPTICLSIWAGLMFRACGLSATFQMHWPMGFHISTWASTPASSGLASAYLYLDGHIKMDQNGSARCTL